MEKIVVFTDMDGTFLEKETYSYELAQPGLSILQARDIPLIFCTSKTRAEIEYYRNKLGIKDPYISENGGSVI